MKNLFNTNQENALNLSLLFGASTLYLLTRKNGSSFYEKVFTIGESFITAGFLALSIKATQNNSKKISTQLEGSVLRIFTFVAAFSFARFLEAQLSSYFISQTSWQTKGTFSLVAGTVSVVAYNRMYCKSDSSSSSPSHSSSSSLTSSSSPSHSTPSSLTSSMTNASIQQQPFFDASSKPIPLNDVALQDEETRAIIDARKPLTTYLSSWFDLDELGYIKCLKGGIEQKGAQKALTQNEAVLGKHFYDVSHAGDSGYAEEIRVTLAGMDIASSPVEKQTGALLINSRSYSFVPLTVNKTSGHVKTEPPVYNKKKPQKNEPAYLGLWENEIWKGYKAKRDEAKQAKLSHDSHTVFQKIDYLKRCERVKTLHKEGLLLGRVANTEEARDFMSHRYNMNNDILSTTLWPKEGSPLKIQLFSEYGTDTVGLLLDPKKVGAEDFGVGFHQNAVTVGSGFIQHKYRKSDQGDGTTSIYAQKELLEAFEKCIVEGGSTSDLIVKRDTPEKYSIKKVDGRSGSKNTSKNTTLLWNEQTYYRGIEKDFFTGFFVKSDSDSFSKELKNLFILQDHIRRYKGVYVPIFQFKGKTNELEELVPDSLLLTITGATQIKPFEGRTNRLSEALKEAGITEDMALAMTGALPQGGNISGLLELQLLMFNMKDIMGQMTVKSQYGYTNQYHFIPVRLLDNLHLVFPTIHKTQNEDAKQPDLFFTHDEVNTIHQTPALIHYLQITLKHHLNRFLGISVDGQNIIIFDATNASLFDTTDPKRADFAKVLSRGMQCAVLFNIFGDHTLQVIEDIIKEVRKTWPYLGIAPSGHDRILKSEEMQAIYALRNLPLFNPLPPKKEANEEIPSSPVPDEAIDPFAKKISLPTLESLKAHLEALGVEKDRQVINVNKIQELQKSDPYLDTYEKELLQTLHLLHVLKEGNLAQKIMTGLRQETPTIGYNASGEDLSESKKGSLLTLWIEAQEKNLPPPFEFPFQKIEAKKPVSSFTGRRGRGQLQDEEDEDNKNTRFRGRGRGLMHNSSPSAQPLEKKSGLTTKTATLSSDQLRKEVKERALIPKWNQQQIGAANALGLINQSGILWEQIPEFYDGQDSQQKPKAPYIAPEDVLGACAPHLMTGPAFHLETLENDRKSFQITTSQDIKKEDLKRLITHTLAVTTEGDKQVLRANGLHYSHSVSVPAGGQIDYNGGNEKHRFRSNDKREFHTSSYKGMGGYGNDALKEVEKHDKLLLSDEERRKKRAHVLPHAYVTVTAQGGYGSERTPLERAWRVLYLETAGAQFEKYGRGAFTYLDGSVDPNELEASDFIIKKGAGENASPLFPDYYKGGKIPAHHAIPANDCAALDQGDFAKPFALLKDGSLFHRKAFEVANAQYMDLVLDAINSRLGKDKPYYLKATFFGGGFFADAGAGGNLRMEILYAHLTTYIKMLQQQHIPQGSAIEFPRYGEVKSLPQGLYENLITAAKNAGVHIIWTPEGDICDYAPQTTTEGTKIEPAAFEQEGTLIVLGAADVMSWSGNERTSASVEAAFGNNSNLRLVMNWWANPYVLKFTS